MRWLATVIVYQRDTKQYICLFFHITFTKTSDRLFLFDSSDQIHPYFDI